MVVASNRAAAGVYADETGPLIVAWLREQGFTCEDAAVVPDGEPVGEAVRSAVAAGARAVLTTGGTGLTPTDRTPEVTAALLDREVPGIAESIRAAGVAAGVPTAMLSRGLAGVVGDCLVVNLPGSRGGVKDGLAVLEPVLRHAVEITATVRTADRTGVEMEALTAVSVAALTVIDMVKAVDKAAVITDVRVEAKSGGRSGDWPRP